MNESLLVSFCNTTGAPKPLVARVTTDGSGKITTLVEERYTSACGLAIYQDAAYIACSDATGSSALLIVGLATLEVLERIPLPSVQDIHSICIDQADTIFAASTGTDEVVSVSLLKPEQHSTVWRASGEGADTHHVNAVTFHNEKLVASAFGKRTAERWYTAREGYVIDAGSNKRLIEGLYHPHSIVSHDDILYVCESSAARVVSDGAFRFTATRSYIRGLTFLRDDRIALGNSVGRVQSMLPQDILNPADPGHALGRCGVELRSLSANTVEFINLSAYASEVYDVASIPSGR